MNAATSTVEVTRRSAWHRLTPWHCWRCITWNAAVVLCIAGCGAYLGLVPSNVVGLAAVPRVIAKVLPLLIILLEIFQSPTGVKSFVIRASYGALYWLSYHGLAWATGGWPGSPTTTLIGALLGAMVGLGVVLLAWALGRDAEAEPMPGESSSSASTTSA